MKYLQTIIISSQNPEKIEEKLHEIIKELAIQPVDITVVEDNNSIGIEDIRDLIPALFIAPAISPYRLVVIKDLHHATAEAQNALLKTLEEPPPRVFLLATTTQLDSLLPTIISRAQVINVADRKNSQKAEDFSSDLDIIFHQTPAAKINFLSDKIKNREDAIIYVQRLISYISSCFKKTDEASLHDLSKLQLLLLIKKLGKAKEFIERNINPRLTLEVLFLNTKNSPPKP